MSESCLFIFIHFYRIHGIWQNLPNILSQSYNASVFYFDNISFLEHVSNQLFLPNESSISQASYCTMVLTIC